MPATYEKIATTTLGSANATITLSSIPATYTDLKLVLVSQNTVGGNLTMQFNSDSATNYSGTTLFGSGASASSERFGSATSLRVGNPTTGSTNWYLFEIDIFSYAGSTNKTEFTTANLDMNGSGSIRKTVGLWRSTAAITALSLTYDSGTHSIGTIATLYGILKA
jgi:hypothetical protein